MRVIFMGTPDFAVPSLEALLTKHEVVLVVTQPDKPKGRGKKMVPTPVKACALEHGIPVLQPEKVKEPEFVEQLRSYEPDLIAVTAFGQILSEPILEMPKYGCINVHASLLPKYRGAAPIQWSIIEGEAVTGVTTMQMDEGLDTGDMIMKAEVPVSEDETGETLHDKLAAAGAKLCVETLEALEKKTAVFEKQGESPTAYAKMLTKEMGNIDWAQPAVRIERLIRGLNSWPSAYTHWNGKVMKIWRAKADTQTVEDMQMGDDGRSGARGTIPGTVTSVGKEEFTVQTGDGGLRVYEVQIPGKKRMETGAFLRGYTMETGTILTRE